MKVRGRPLTLAFAAATFGAAGLLSAFVILVLAGWLLVGEIRHPAVVTAAWQPIVFAVAVLVVGGGYGLVGYYTLRAAWGLWLRHPWGLGIARNLAWLFIAWSALGAFAEIINRQVPWPIFLVIAVDVCLYLPATTREFKPAWLQTAGA